MKQKEKLINMICKHCKSENTVKFGFDYRASGKIQRWRCKDCFRLTIQNEVQTTE